MSVEPPKPSSVSRGVPGAVIPLIFLSIILLGAVLVFGALAFDIGLPGTDDEREFARPEEVLEATEFTLRERTMEEEITLLDVEVTITNTGDRPVDTFDVMVQCSDNGYVSAIIEVSPMEANEARTIAMQLIGRGEPSCSEPVIDFSGGSASS